MFWIVLIGFIFWVVSYRIVQSKALVMIPPAYAWFSFGTVLIFPILFEVVVICYYENVGFISIGLMTLMTNVQCLEWYKILVEYYFR